MTHSRPRGSVFISHSHQDNELVRDLARRLRDAGLKPVADLSDIPAGAEWRKVVRERLREAEAMIILVTPAALSSAWMMAELGMAEGFERLILPVVAGLKPRSLPAPLQSYQVIPFDEVDRAIEALAERLAPATKD